MQAEQLVAPATLLYVLAEQTVLIGSTGVGVGVGVGSVGQGGAGWAVGSVGQGGVGVRFGARWFSPRLGTLTAPRCPVCDVLVQARVAPLPKLEKPTEHVQVLDSARLVLLLGKAVQLVPSAALNVLAPHAVRWRARRRAGARA